MTLDKADSAADRSPIVFRLDPASGVPTYLQLVHQVERAVRLGYLAPGDQLPRVREVVESLAINPNTVLKAYRELEHKGLASGRPGQGTFVTGGLGSTTFPELASLRRSLLDWLQEAAEVGLDHEGISALVSSTVLDFTKGRDSGAAPAAALRTRQGGGAA
jgi:GntR family transcriptional regulator